MSGQTYSSRCPRCNTSDAYPAIATDQGEAAFVLICAYNPQKTTSPS